MITALVQFTLPQAVSLAQARTLFAGSAPNYLGLDGLVRKVYLLSADGRTAGGVYLWRSREAAEGFYDEAGEVRRQADGDLLPEPGDRRQPARRDPRPGVIAYQTRSSGTS